MRGLPAISRPGSASGRRSRAKPGEFAADELALMLRGQPYQVRCLVARARRMAAALPTVWEAFRRGELDAEQMRVIDRVAGGSPKPRRWPPSTSRPLTRRTPGRRNSCRCGCCGWSCNSNRWPSPSGTAAP